MVLINSFSVAYNLLSDALNARTGTAKLSGYVKDISGAVNVNQWRS